MEEEKEEEENEEEEGVEAKLETTIYKHPNSIQAIRRNNLACGESGNPIPWTGPQRSPSGGTSVVVVVVVTNVSQRRVVQKGGTRNENEGGWLVGWLVGWLLRMKTPREGVSEVDAGIRKENSGSKGSSLFIIFRFVVLVEGWWEGRRRRRRRRRGVGRRTDGGLFLLPLVYPLGSEGTTMRRGSSSSSSSNRRQFFSFSIRTGKTRPLAK
ncbi:hypothetical protein M0802_005695 [Mischocyttarus mexicanus]|nr:hypothetical protein M0802_005695 [Mischocyttarus mexicanus]